MSFLSNAGCDKHACDTHNNVLTWNSLFAVCCCQNKVLPNEQSATWMFALKLEWCHVGPRMRLCDLPPHYAALSCPLHRGEGGEGELIHKLQNTYIVVSLTAMVTFSFILPVKGSSWNTISQCMWNMVVVWSQKMHSVSGTSRRSTIYSQPSNSHEGKFEGNWNVGGRCHCCTKEFTPFPLQHETTLWYRCQLLVGANW